MRTFSKITLSLLAAVLSTYLFERLFQQFSEYNWLGYNVFMEDAESFTLGYALFYLFIFFLFLVFRWSTTSKRVLLSSALILVGGLLPVLAVLTRNFRHTNLDLAGIYQRVQGSFAAVFVTNLVVLGLINLLFWLMRKPAPKLLFKSATH